MVHFLKVLLCISSIFGLCLGSLPLQAASSEEDEDSSSYESLSSRSSSTRSSSLQSLEEGWAGEAPEVLEEEEEAGPRGLAEVVQAFREDIRPSRACGFRFSLGAALMLLIVGARIYKIWSLSGGAPG